MVFANPKSDLKYTGTERDAMQRNGSAINTMASYDTKSLS
jgi:hypothetical protein